MCSHSPTRVVFPQPAGASNVPTGQSAAQIHNQPVTSPAAPAAGFDAKGRVRRTRSGGAWVGLITAAVFLILLVIFIAQNTGRGAPAATAVLGASAAAPARPATASATANSATH
jgi:hypothetical protein